LKSKKKIFWHINRIFHETTSSIRCLPNFIIIGNSYCGKTLLYNYLTEHKLILKNLREETSYFTNNFDKGFGWYKSNFPNKISKFVIRKIYGKKPRIGETINLPWEIVPKRISQVLGKPKIILILRNPVERTYARYLALVRRGLETLSFEDAIMRKEESWYGKKDDLNENKIYYKDNQKISLYLSRSIYVDDLKRWGEFFPKENMLVIPSEELFLHPLKTVNVVLDFLELPHLKKLKNEFTNLEHDSPPINLKTYNRLKEFFKPYNEELFNYLGKDLGW
jgi:hypothetical protein